MSNFNIEVLKNARPSEIIVACLLSHFIFSDKTFIVGDCDKQADIIAKDSSLAIEAVRCELQEVYDCNNAKEKHFKSSDEPFFFNYSSDTDQVQQRFHKVITDKFKKLNNGNYANSPKDICLAIDSMVGVLDLYDITDFKKAFCKVAKNFEIKFKSVYFLCRQGVIEYDYQDIKKIHQFYIKKDNHATNWTSEFCFLVCDIERQFNIDLSLYK